MRIIPVALFVILFLIIGIPVLGIEWLIGDVYKRQVLVCSNYLLTIIISLR